MDITRKGMAWAMVNADIYLCVICAVYNRASTSSRSLGALKSALTSAGIRFTVVLVDDGSTDGTANAVRRLDLPGLIMLRSSGGWYWARSMEVAEAVALGLEQTTHLLWFNDDVLVSSTVGEQVCLAVDEIGQSAIAVGATRGSDGRVSYSGLTRAGRHPLAFERRLPDGRFQHVDTMNGNFVIVPRGVACDLGGIDGRFAHGMADIEYGYRAQQHGVKVLLMPEFAGLCDRNVEPARRGLVADIRAFIDIKGAGNPRALARLLRRVGSRRWVLYWIRSYAVFLARAIPRGRR